MRNAELSAKNKSAMDAAGKDLIGHGVIEVPGENLCEGRIGRESWIGLLANEKFWINCRVTI